MSALAIILAKRGYSISGSDKKDSHSLKHLAAQGIKIFKDQNSKNIQELCKGNFLQPLIVVSTAVPANNSELRAAKKNGLKIAHRSDILAALIKKQASIAVAGSHGKTTTSTFIATLLTKSNQDPTAVIGGVLPYLNTNGHVGRGKWLVAEADESDGSLLKFKAEIGVITNLELDHTDHYTDLKALIKTMKSFGRNCKQLLANNDCPNIRKNIKATAWWSTKTIKGVDFAALPKKIHGNKTIADIYEKGQLIGQIEIPIPGIHNLSNAIAAIAACRLAGISFDLLRKNLYYLKTPGRRFEFRGIWQGRQIVDDYAHHPSEVEATLKMARLMINSDAIPLPKSPKRIVTIFQAHRYSRLQQFLNDFAIALGESDLILIAPIYSAGETPIKGVNNEILLSCIRKHYSSIPILIANELNKLPHLLEKNTQEDDLILTLGAGDINKLWGILQPYKENNKWEGSQIAA